LLNKPKSKKREARKQQHQKRKKTQKTQSYKQGPKLKRNKTEKIKDERLYIFIRSAP